MKKPILKRGRTMEKRREWPGLLNARVEAGLTRREACKGICAESTLAGWEDGSCLPPRSAVDELAKRYGVSTRSLK